MQWVDDFAPGTTRLAGMINADTRNWLHADALVRAHPGFGFLFSEIGHGEDVEIAFADVQATIRSSATW